MADKEGKDENKTIKEIERLAKEQAKKEAKESKEAKALEVKSRKEAEAADKKARKEAERLAKEKAKKEAEEAKRAKKEAERLAKEQAKQAEKKTAKEAPPPPSEGNYQLVLPSSVGFKPLKQFTDHLAGVKDLKIVWTGGSTDEGILIAVSVAPSVPLAQILSDMPMVEGVEVKGAKITITPKFSI